MAYNVLHYCATMYTYVYSNWTDGRTANVSASASREGAGVESADSPGRRTVKWGSPL